MQRLLLACFLAGAALSENIPLMKRDLTKAGLQKQAAFYKNMKHQDNGLGQDLPVKDYMNT